MGMGRVAKRKVVPANANPELPRSQRVAFGLAPTGEAGASELGWVGCEVREHAMCS
jgi:hypothetical protein